MNLEQIGENCLERIKRATWFPVDSGHLRNDATKGKMYDENTYEITFNTEIAPYIEALEEGSKPHDILFAFGRKKWKNGDYPFGVGGKFDGKFHPGSTKHQGFIKDKSVNAIINYIKTKYNGELR